MKGGSRSNRLDLALEARANYTSGHVTAKQAFDWLIAMSLEDQDRKVLHFVIENGRASSYEVADAFQISQQQAATVLLRLYRLDLLSREEQRNSNGRFYVYQDKDRNHATQP